MSTDCIAAEIAPPPQASQLIDDVRRLEISRHLVAAKIQNGRVLLRRNGPADDRSLEILRGFASAASAAATTDELLGIEGASARLYYSLLPSCLKGDSNLTAAFDLEGRNRRPPRDPINALLSFAYVLLTKDWLVALQAVGFHPHRDPWFPRSIERGGVSPPPGRRNVCALTNVWRRHIFLLTNMKREESWNPSGKSSARNTPRRRGR